MWVFYNNLSGDDKTREYEQNERLILQSSSSSVKAKGDIATHVPITSGKI